MDLDKRINNLEPGESLKIGGTDKIWTMVERSGSGKI